MRLYTFYVPNNKIIKYLTLFKINKFFYQIIFRYIIKDTKESNWKINQFYTQH